MRSYRRRMNEDREDDVLASRYGDTIELKYHFDINTTDGFYPEFKFTYEVSKNDIMNALIDGEWAYEFCIQYDLTPCDTKKEWITFMNDPPFTFDLIFDDYYYEVLKMFEDDAKQALFDMVKDTPDFSFDIRSVNDIR